MSNIESASRCQHRNEPAPDFALCFFFKIDYDVSTENRLKFTFHRPVADQIQFAKRYQLAHFLADTPHPTLVTQIYEPSAAQLGRDGTDDVVGVDSLRSFRDHVGIDIGRQNLDVVGR